MKYVKSGKIDKRWSNGGARIGAGRPLSQDRIFAIEHALEKIVVKERRYGQVRRVKKPRIIVVLDKLYNLGMGNPTYDNRTQIKALKIFLDLALGKPVRNKEVTYKKKNIDQNEILRKIESTYGYVDTTETIIPSILNISKKMSSESVQTTQEDENEESYIFNNGHKIFTEKKWGSHRK